MMTKNILVFSNSINSQIDTIKTAAKFAVKNNSCLTGLYIKVDLIKRYYSSKVISVELTNDIIEEEKKYERHAKQEFNKITKNIGCNTVWNSIDESEELVNLMFYIDLIFISHNTNKEDNLSHKPDFRGLYFIKKLLLETRRPIVIIPDGWNQNDFGQKILFGWNESRESARAMHETLLFMQKAQKVDVVIINETKKHNGDLAKSMNISDYLASHGIKCKLNIDHTDKETSKIGEVILAQANKHNSDLLITGGYGHSHIREVLLGGVTRYLIQNTNIPFLLAH
jgi:hypothetical protein